MRELCVKQVIFVCFLSLFKIREEDKDPVYKYLESMMTCARVREFNSKPPPVLTLEPDTSTPKPKPSATPQETTTDGQPKKYYRTLLTAGTEPKQIQ